MEWKETWNNKWMDGPANKQWNDELEGNGIGGMIIQ